MRFLPCLHRTVLVPLALLGLLPALSAGCGGDDVNFTTGSSGAGAAGKGGTGGAGATGATGGTGGEQLNCVLDGKLGPNEECDDGNMIPGDGCELDCSF